MRNLFRLLGLQFFGGEGASSGGDGGSGASGVSSGDGQSAAAAGQGESLASMGVPQKDIEKYRAIKQRRNGEVAPAKNTEPDMQKTPQLRQFSSQQFTEDAAQQDAAAEDPNAQKGRKSLKDALRENGDWNREMQTMMSERVNKTNADRQEAREIANIIAAQYGLSQEDPANLDLKALREAVENDDGRYRKLAAELGTDTETAKKIDQTKRENAKLKAQQQRAQQEAALQAHYRNLQAQAEELKREIPDFDLERELNSNREFYERTLPGSRDTVKSAYYALHGEEIVSKKVNQAVGGARQAMANAQRSGRNIPLENGAVNRAAGSEPKPLPYSQMNPEQRKQWLQSAKAGRRFN